MPAMIALRPSKRIAKQLALPGGDPWHKLHVTVVFLGNPTPDQLEAIRAVVMPKLQTRDPIPASISGIGRFSIPDRDAFYASVDSRALEILRGEALEAVQGIGLDVPLNHGYSPHITLRYLEHDAPLPMQRLEPIRYDFRSLQLWVDDTRETWEFSAT